ncbi:MAG: glycosyl hydrolase family 18 protein, partial [Candidatus Kariarchaeaceae archaeon]
NRDQNFSVVSHLAWFAIEINADGTIGSTHGWPEWDVINAVHNAGNKVILTVTLFDFNDIHTLLTSYKTTAVNNLLAQVQAGNADGINIDFEMPKTSGDDVLLVEFMEILYNTFKSARNDYHVSIASPSVDWWGTWDYEELNNYVDAFMIMAYGYYYKGSLKAGPLSPLERPLSTYDVNWSVNDYISKGASKSKIILGLPFYGLNFPVTSTNKHADRDTSRGNAESPTYSSVMNIISTYNPTIFYDDDYETAWFNYDRGEGDRQVWFDNYTSLERKFDYVNDRELGGLGIWAYGYQGTYTELERLIVNKFSSDPDSEHPPTAFILTTDAEDPDVDGSFYLNWTHSSGADYYNVYRSPSPILTVGSGTLIDSTITVNYTKITNQISDYYYFAVVAYNGTGSTISNYVEVNVLLNVELTSIDAGNPDRDGEFQLSWEVNLGYDNYSLYSYDSPITEINDSIDLIREGLTNSSYHISGITNDTIIYYIIVGFTTTGNMSSNYVDVEVLYGYPGEFGLSSSILDAAGNYILTWTYSDGANNYTIYRSPYYMTYLNESYIDVVKNTDYVYHYIGGLGNGIYYFIIVAFNNYGNSTSNCIQIIVDKPTSDDDDDDKEGDNIFEILTTPTGMFLIGISSGIFVAVIYGLIRGRAHKATKKEREKLHIISRDARRNK